jgi:hypothetical protein
MGGSENVLALDSQSPFTIFVAAATTIVGGRMRGLFMLLLESAKHFAG